MQERKISTLILTQRDILEAGCFDIGMAIDTAREAVLSYAAGRIMYPDKVSQIFDETTQNRTNCLPATLLDRCVSGMKWVSVFPANASRYGLQNLSAAILLSSTRTGFPLVFMEGSLVSNMRTAAVSALAASALAKREPTGIGFVGAGEQAKFHMLAIKKVFPGLKKCFVSSRTEKTESRFVQDLSPLLADVEFIPCGGSFERAVSNADIIVSAISGQAPVIQSEWINKGAFYAHVGGWEDDYSVPLSADKIVCDHWQSVKHRTQTISRLYKMGRLTDNDIYCDLDALLTGQKPGRESEDEFIYFNTVGLSYVDVALADRVYEICRSKGLGLSVDLQELDPFTALKEGLGKC